MGSVDAVATPTGGFASQLVRAVRWRLPVLLLVALPLSAAGLWELDRQPDVYEAVAVLSVAPRPGEIASSDLLRLSAQRLAVGVGSDDTLAGVAERTGVSASDLASHVEISVPSETANIRIVVRMESAKQAARIANLLGVAGQSRWSGDPLVFVDLASPAAVPEQPAWPPRTLLGALIVLLGAASGLAAAMVVERLRPRLRTPYDVEAAAGAPVLGSIPRAREPSGPLTGALDGEPLGSAVRSLRTRVLAQSSARNVLRSVALTGVGSSSTHTWTSTLLSLALARSGHRTALVYTDPTWTTARLLARLELEGRTDADGEPRAHLDGATARLMCTRLVEDRLLVLAPAPEQAAGDGLAVVLPKLISDAGQTADLVVVDAPVLSDDIARSAVVTLVEGVVLVVPRGSLAAACRSAAAHLEELGIPLLGTVVDNDRRRARTAARAAERRRRTAGTSVRARTRRAGRDADRRRTPRVDDGVAGA